VSAEADRSQERRRPLWLRAYAIIGGLACLGLLLFAVLVWLLKSPAPIPWKPVLIWTASYAVCLRFGPRCAERQRIFGLDLGAEIWKRQEFSVKAILIVFSSCALAYACLCLALLALNRPFDWLLP